MKTYKSKIGLELIIPIATLFGWVIYKSIIDEKWMATIIILIAIVFICFLFFNIKYKIEKENLIISRVHIDIKNIRKISETYNPVSSPAASIDRLEIMYNKYDTILISPKDKKGFIDSLLAINPNIEVVYRKKWAKI